MGDWMNTFDGIFFISLATMFCGFAGLTVKYCLKSKCEHLSLCGGLIVVDRRVDLEVEEEIHQMDKANKDLKENESKEEEFIV